MKNDDARNMKGENAKLDEQIRGDEDVERQGTKNQEGIHSHVTHRLVARS